MTIRKQLLTLAAVITSLFVFTLVSPRPAAAAIDTAAAEQRFYEVVNAARAAAGKAALQTDPRLASLALDWSTSMAATSTLSHRPGLASYAASIEPNWTGAAENVGTSNDPGTGTIALADSLHASFMKSHDHYINIMGDYNRVGVGFIQSGGNVWVTVNFLKGPSAIPTVEGPARSWSPSGYEALTPYRLVDTRQTAAMAPGGTLTVQPNVAGAEAVAINVTTTQSKNPGFITVYPCGTAVPNASNLNYAAGETRAVFVTVALAGGAFCVFNGSGGHLIVDLQGVYKPNAGARYQPQAPRRLLDTRATGPVTSARVTIPGGASAAGLNVTALSTGGGFVTVYPCDVALPNTSNVNTGGGTPVANLVFSRVAANSQVCLTASSAMNLIVDLQGIFSSGGALTSASEPRRVLDTRQGIGGYSYKSHADTNQPIVLNLRSSGRIPANAQGAMLTATITGAMDAGFLSVYPCDAGLPQASNLNFSDGQTVANSVAAKVDANGQVCIATSARTDVIIDVAGALV
jgi:uncharacterized protein YkwD